MKIEAYEVIFYHDSLYTENTNYSGGAFVEYLGNSEENDLIWNNVYSENGGEYTMTLSFITGEDRDINISVNDEYVTTITCNSNSWSNTATKQVTLNLLKGDNKIRLYNSTGWMPNIDYMQIVNNNPTGVISNSIKDSSADEYVNVYGINGVLIKQNVKRENATDNLENGQYIVGNKVVIVNK